MTNSPPRFVNRLANRSQTRVNLSAKLCAKSPKLLNFFRIFRFYPILPNFIYVSPLPFFRFSIDISPFVWYNKTVDHRGVAQLGRKIDRCQWQIKGDFSSGSDLPIGKLPCNEASGLVTTGSART